MSQKREKEETELKVPQSIGPLCTPNLPLSRTCVRTPDISDPKLSISPEISDLAESDKKESRLSVKRPREREVSRCSGIACRRKVGLIGFRCRCGEVFCSEHRYSDRHNCSYDYKAAGREAIARENPVVRAAKILKL